MVPGTLRLALVGLLAGCKGPPPTPFSVTPIDGVVFYDGYAGLVEEPVPAGVVRLRNDLVAHRLDDALLDGLSASLRVDVTLRARCDNYDRLGSVNLAFVPKGRAAYEPDAVDHVELGRFITPFMDVNQTPREVDYTFDASPLVGVLRDSDLREDHDVWLELELFGVPYAANEEIAGCAGRNDVYQGSVTLASEGTPETATPSTLLPLAHRAPFNDYQPGASDALGTTRKTLPFTLPDDVEAAQLVVVVSNHGAGAGGEEYERRRHRILVDGEQALAFTPGRTTCEPFRRVNTQANGIYGPEARTEEEWQAFSNWCPGDVIDTRMLELGPLAAGAHEVVVDVPRAVFAGDDGDFPLSVYVLTRP